MARVYLEEVDCGVFFLCFFLFFFSSRRRHTRWNCDWSSDVCSSDLAGYTSPWGADADHLKTAEDVRRTAAAGFCFFTIDPSEVVNNHADALAANELESGVAGLEAEGIFPDRTWKEFYLGQRFDLPGDLALRFTKEKLFRAAIKYARAIARSASMGEHVASAMAGRPYEIEVSVDETDS